MPKKTKKAGGKTQKDFLRNASHFRSLLLAAREDYARGRSFAAVDLQKEALEFGSKNLARFDQSSLTKAHALLELGLALSAVCTDFARGQEWEEKRAEMKTVLGEAMRIYHDRLANGTLTTFRKEEVWLKGNSYESAVPHTERLGPIDFVTCTHMSAAMASPEAVAAIKKALRFLDTFRANKCVLVLEGGGALQGELPDGIMIDDMKTNLARHEQELATGVAVDRDDSPEREEVRHTGTRLGKMKLSKEKLARDVEKKGLHKCGYGECDKAERHPREFSRCSGCKWTPYCCREHQVKDWPVHKKMCKTVAAEQRKEFEESRKAKDTLLPGQAQNFITVVAHLHHYFLNAEETKSSIMRVCPEIISKLKSVEDHGKLRMDEIGLIWQMFWGVSESLRLPLLERFVEDMDKMGFPSKAIGGPDFSIVLGWHEHAVTGLFVVVKHTKKGAILLHDDESTVKAFQVTGITQSLESMMIGQPLPIYIGTALLPFHGLIVTQGTLSAGCIPSNRLQASAATFLAGKTEEFELITDLLAQPEK